MSRLMSHPEGHSAAQFPRLKSPARRRFLAVAERYGFTTAVLASSGGYLWSDPAVAQAGADEAAKQKAAKHTMLFATEYKLDAYKTYPIMQEAFKENLEAASNGALYVRLHPAGQLGVGAALGQKVQGGTVHGGALSLSNFSPFAPVVDVINIPFWCGENQRFANLVTSPTWADEINPRVNAKNFKPMFYYTVDPRTIAARKGLGRIIKSPDDMRGLKMRIPPSKLLGKFYQLAGANPTIVPWGETPTALKQGVADALDPAIGALYTFGFIDILESITAVASVPDAQMFACNLPWYNSLPKELQTKFEEASEKTQEASFNQIEVARKTSIDAMTKAGIKFYKPSDAERKRWVEACGEQRAEWNEHKVELAGSTANFDKLRTAADTKGRYTVGDYQGVSMRRFLKAIDRDGERYLMLVFYCTIVFVIVTEVLRRFVFSYSSLWGEEVARYAFIYLGWVGASYGVKQRAHIRFDVVLLAIPKRFHGYVFIFGDLVTLVFACFAMYWSLHVIGTLLQFGGTSYALRINKAWFEAAIPLSFAMMMVRLVQSFVRDVRDLRAGRDANRGALMFD